MATVTTTTRETRVDAVNQKMSLCCCGMRALPPLVSAAALATSTFDTAATDLLLLTVFNNSCA